MSCNIRVPLQQIIDDVAAALSDGFVKKDNAVLDGAVLTNATLRGALSIDTAAQESLCLLLQSCGISGAELEWLERPTAAGLVAISSNTSQGIGVSWLPKSIIKGDIGPTGVAGPTGPKGDIGVSVVNVSHNADNTLTFLMSNNTSFTSRSIKGDQGIQGIQGIDPYEVAKLEGFIGTRAEWLLSLKPTEGTLQALTQFMNNNAETNVTVPELGNIPSLQGYIKEMFENGGLPATPFDNYAAMLSSDLVDGDYAIVTNDTDEANGIYKKVSGVFVSQSYNSLTSIAEHVSGTISGNLVEFVDRDGTIYMLTDSEGKLRISGIDDDVQSVLEQSKNTTKTLNDTANIAGQSGMAMMLVDDSGKLIFAVKNNGQLVTGEAKPLSIKREHYIKPAVNYHNPLQQVAAPVPLNFIPLDFNAPAELLSLRVTQPVATKIDTIYYKDDGVVHPNILDFYSGINGHQYWLGITPYHLNNDDFENPFVYTSDDLKSFALNNDFTPLLL